MIHSKQFHHYPRGSHILLMASTMCYNSPYISERYCCNGSLGINMKPVTSHITELGKMLVMSMLDTLLMYEFWKLSNVICGLNFHISVLSSTKQTVRIH